MNNLRFRFYNIKTKSMSEAWSLADLAYEGFPEEYKNEYGDVLDKDCIVMQYTNTQDKNAHYICEGDIVKGYSCYEDDYEEVIGQVLLKGDQFCLCDKNGDALEYFDDGSYSIYGLEYWKYNDNDDEMEILGNIFQNKKLLN